MNIRRLGYALVMLFGFAVAICTSAHATVPISFSGQWGGPCKVADVSGNYAYMGMGPRLVVLDITNSAKPTPVWQSEPFGGIIRGVTVSGSFAYVTGREGLMIFDLSNPASPVRRGTYVGGSEDGTVGIALPGKYICLADNTWGMVVVDVSNADSPVQAGICNLAEEGDAYGVTVSGGRAYVRFETEFCVVDLSNPTSPQFVGYLWDWDSWGVAMANGYMYVVKNYYEADSEMIIMDVSTLPRAQYVGRCKLSGRAYGVTVSGNRAYVSSGESGLDIIDVSDVKNPVLVSSCNTPGIARQTTIAANKAFVASDYGGLQIVDLTNPSSPSITGGYYASTDARKLKLSSGRAYIADGIGGLQILDVSDPTKPLRLGGYDTSGQATDVTVAGNYAYIADAEAGVQVMDITNPANPLRVGGYDTDDSAVAVAVSGNYAYVADQRGGLQVLDVSNPALPVRVGLYDPADWVTDIVISGNYAYVTAGELRVLDISDPTNPVLLGSGNWLSYATGLDVAGRYAYPLHGYMYIYDVTNPASPTYVGEYDRTDTWATDVVVRNNYAYLADMIYGLQVVDVSIPTRTVLAGEHRHWGTCHGIAVSDNYVFEAMGEFGLEVCRVGTADAPSVTSITPDQAADSSAASIQITGTGFEPGAEVRLTRAGQADIVATSVIVVDSTKITCTADITAKQGGGWNVVITNPESLSAFIVDGFTIMDTTPPTIKSIHVYPNLVPIGTKVWVGLDVTDSTGVVGATANGTELTFMGSGWGKYIPVPATPGIHNITVTARDAAGNTTDSSHSCKLARIVGTTNRALLAPIMAEASTNFLFRTQGQVTKIDNNNFRLGDGSGKSILVYFPTHGLQTGNYAVATGEWQPNAATPVLNAAPYSIRKIQ